jgi:predicted signal transduction protein with EAL and GGDEF domain
MANGIKVTKSLCDTMETVKIPTLEALWPWPHPIRKDLAPDFITVAEASGAVVLIGQLMLSDETLSR